MKTKINLEGLPALTLTLLGAVLMMAQQTRREAIGAPLRPQGSCDVYAADGAPCVAAHSSVRALYASYNGPLYQVLRQSDGKTLDIGVVKPSVWPVADGGGYADAAAQDAFCANTYCWIIKLYDQSGKGNHLVQAPRGAFSGPAMGGFNNVPVADLAPITIMGHKAYGVFIEPGMGLRWNDAHGTAVDDQAEGQYWVIDGHYYNSGCCYDYGNAETDSRDDGNGTMETTYYGNASAWYRGPVPGPWIMTDQENNLVGCVNAEGNNKYCAEVPNITWRFVTAIAKGEPHHWTSLGGDSQKGALAVMFNGRRVNDSYDPMRKQGGILLGNGGDNSNSSQGTFYEGAMTAAGTFPTDATDQKVQANVVAARYDVARLSVAPASAVSMPPRLQTFSPVSSQDTTVTFRNTTESPVSELRLSLSVPAGWTAVASGLASSTTEIAPGASVSATFKVTSGPAPFNGDLVGMASWTVNGTARTESAIEKVRNVSPVKINEFRISAGVNPTDTFIELYNASNSAVDISNWTLSHHPAQFPIFSAVKVPAGTSLGAKSFYLLGLSTSGLSVPASAGETTIYVRSTTGMNIGNTITIGSGTGAETRKIASLGTAASTPLTLWQPLPDGPVITIPAGSTSVPFTTPGGRGVTLPTGFVVGEKVALGYGATYPTVSGSIEKYEVVTVTAVGKPGTQAWLTAPAKAGETNLKVSSVANLTAGDQIRLDIDSAGHGIETVTVKNVGTQSARNAFKGALNSEELGTGLELTIPLKFNHSSNIPFSSRGTGMTFTPKTAFAHSSNEPITPLGSGLKLDQPLASAYEIDAVVDDAAVTTAGYQHAPTPNQPQPNQWFGGPALGPNAGNMVLRDAGGRVVDSLNFGGLVDPWAAEGYQALSGAGANGCSVASPSAEGRGSASVQPSLLPNRSSGRFPDGADTDSNCNDFALQTATTMEGASAVGSNNLKVVNVSGFAPGQTIVIDTGGNQETAIIATVGTQGAAKMEIATAIGATAITVSDAAAFAPGQIVTIDSGVNQESAVVVSGGGRGRGGQPASGSISVSVPLTRTHAAGAEIAGTGITIMGGLAKAHDSGAPVANGVPTPGAPNQYSARR